MLKDLRNILKNYNEIEKKMNLLFELFVMTIGLSQIRSDELSIEVADEAAIGAISGIGSLAVSLVVLLVVSLIGSLVGALVALLIGVAALLRIKY